MPVNRLGPSSNLRKAGLTSGGGLTFGQPASWLQTTYGPGMAIPPVGTSLADAELPRAFDYPLSGNTQITPRTGYGLAPFALLNAAYEGITEANIPVELICRELTSFNPHLIDEDGNEVSDHPYQWMCISPDRKTPYTVWQTRFLKSCKVYDAASVYMHQNPQGIIDALHYIDGSTLFVIVDQWGNIPQPDPIREYAQKLQGADQQQYIKALVKYQNEHSTLPERVPAYTQVIKGTPFAWWSADQVWYMPQSRRTNAPYGQSFIEVAWSWLMVIANITGFELAHYKTGNMPEGFVTLPKDQYANISELNAQELLYNARISVGATERQRLRMFPDGTKYFPTKKPDFPAQLYKQAWNNVLHAIGIPPSEFGEVPGQGLGGKGFKEGAATDLSRNTLNPHRDFIASLFNFVLEKDGVDDVTFELGYPQEEIDPDKLKQSVYDGMAHGTYTLNDALGQLGLNPVDGSMQVVQDHNGNEQQIPVPSHIANKHLIVAGANIFVVEDMQTSGGMAVPSAGQTNNAGGAPMGPESIAEQAGAEHSPDDIRVIQQAIQHLRAGGTLDGKTISVPSTATTAKDSRKLAKADAVEQANAVIEELDSRVDEDTFPLDKHCGVCPEDDEYFGAPISREIQLTFPNDRHANGVEIVAATPDDLPAKPFLWKPFGSENDSLQEWIGGPQYVREEAAYLLDRALGFMLVPVAYVAEASDEIGAAVYYTPGMLPPLDPGQYAPQWIERAAVLDYIASQQDRGYHHNYGTHPDDTTRMILFDNGLAFPVNPDDYCKSPFCELMLNKPLSDGALNAIRVCLGDAAAWRDILSLVGPQATAKARYCAKRLLDNKMVTHYSAETAVSS